MEHESGATEAIPAITDSNSAQNWQFPWQRDVEAARVETDPEKLRRRVEAAEAAVFLRSQQLVNSSDGAAERQAISGAIEILRLLQTKKLHYPDWNKK